jgi:hypothetical protein
VLDVGHGNRPPDPLLHREADADLTTGLLAVFTFALLSPLADEIAKLRRASTRMRRARPLFDEELSGNPPTEASQTPGVVSRKLNVVKNMTTANALPTRAARTESGRAAISKPITISVTPSKEEKPRMLNTE